MDRDRKRSTEQSSLERDRLLQRSQELLAFALTMAHTGAWELDLVEHTAQRSLEHDQIFGYPRLLPRWTFEMFLDHVVPDDRPHVERTFHHAVTTQTDWSFECRIRRADGELRWIWAAGRHAHDARGRATRMSGIVQDITDRKRTEEALREREDTQAFLLELADALRDKSDADEIMYVASRIVGERLHAARAFFATVLEDHVKVISRDYVNGAPSIAGKFPVEAYVQDIAAILKRDEDLVIADVATDPRLSPHARAAFREAGVAASMCTSLVKNGVWVGFFGVRSTVPRVWKPFELALVRETVERTWAALERARAETALRESEQRYRSLFENMEEGVALIELVRDGHGRGIDFRWLMCNRSFEQLTRLDRQKVIGNLASKLLPDHYEQLVRTYSAVVDLGMVTRFEYEAHQRIWDITAFPYGDDRFIVLFEDITVRKHAEASLHAANERLVELDRRKDEFLAMLSHELRNPLAPLRSGLEVLDRAPPGGEQARRAQATIGRQIGHLTHLVSDLLDVTRIARGKIELQREELELGHEVQRIVEDAAPEFTKAGVQLELEPAPAEVRVSGDRTRLAQVIGNVLHNATKFTSRGGRTVVSLERDDASSRAILRIRDTGRGIAPEFLPHLFDPFTQADMTLDRSMGGLGLGLAVARGVVELHGGTISAESSGVGKGTTFTIALPLLEPAEISPHVNGPTRDRHARRLLLIEDNWDSADMLRDLLRLEGHDVDVAHDGREGLAKARQLHPDVVLCDIGLPELNGFEVARAMRADPELARTVLVALSGYAGPEDVARGKEAGFDAHLAKPPSLEAISNVLARGPAHQPSAYP